jgi:hypothetical protein
VLSLGLTTVQFMLLSQFIIFHPRLAARVDRDHRDLHADLHSVAGQVRRRSAVSSASWWRLNLQTAFPLAARSRWPPST